MRVLAVANGFPRPGRQLVGIFVQREVDALRREGVDVQTFEVRYRPNPLKAARALASRIREVRPDLVHVYSGSIGAFSAGLVSSVPLVVTYTGSDLLGAARGDPWVEQLVCRASVVFSQLAARRADAIIVCSEQLRSTLARRVDRKRAHVIAAGVDVDAFKEGDRDEARRAVGWSSDERIVLFGASRHRAVKRYWLARAAMEELDRLGIDARLESLEHVAPERVPLYLNAADCLLLTSQHEGSPNIVKEAMACACPVVGVPVGDVREMLEAVEPGAVVEASPGALAGALQATLRDGRRSNGAAGIRQRHSAAVVAGRILSVYRSVLESRCAPVRSGFAPRGGDDAEGGGGQPC